MPAEGSQPPEVRLTKSVAAAIRKLPKPQAEAVARAIEAIGKTPARPLLPGADGKQYMIIAPTDDSAPVIIYRELDDGSGYLVTALGERPTYDAYERAERQSSLDSPLRQAVAGTVGAAALAAWLGSRSERAAR